MNAQMPKMNGLSLEILAMLSFESHLGIPLKKNLHYFDKDALIAELIAMTEWLDEQEIFSDIALDYRIKSLDSILLKYDRYCSNHQTRKVFNDILGFRAFCDSYDQILEEESSQFRIVDMTKGKAVDDGYRGRSDGVSVLRAGETGKEDSRFQEEIMEKTGRSQFLFYLCTLSK